MTSKRPWISYNNVNKHPEDSILLAYLRGQELELHSSILQHIEHEKCPVCLQKLDELKQVSATLDVLASVRSYQYYPELSVVETYTRMQNAVNSGTASKTVMNGADYRRRPRKSAMRLISMPVAFGLAILLTMAMLVFANFSGRPFNPFSQIGGTGPVQHIVTIGVQPHTTSTPGVNVTATPIDTPNANGPHIKDCSTQGSIAEMRLVICGFHFDSKHKATLIGYVSGKRSFWTRYIPVDKHGKFQVEWIIADCSNLPILIFAYEASPKPIEVKLQITSFGNCPAITPTPVGKPFGFSPNIVP